MSKRIALVVVLCACVGIAYGAANKIKSFETSNEGLDADGMAILNYVAGQDETIVQIMVSDFTPNETYDLVLTDGATELITAGAITTDENGNAHFHGTFFFDKSTWDVKLYVGEELRATGDNPAG